MHLIRSRQSLLFLFVVLSLHALSSGCKSSAGSADPEPAASARPPGCPDGKLGDDDNCGECGAACTDGARCVDSRCVRTVDIAMMNDSACALQSDGQVACWGGNLYGELGRYTEAKTSGPIEVPDIPEMVEVSAGWRFSCGRTAKGEVYCWGGNGRGQQGVPDMDEFNNPPHKLENITGATALASGLSHSCAVVDGGKVKCWGYNDDGFLVAGAERFIAPTPIAGLENVEQLAIGNFVTCAVRTDDTMTCWAGDGYSEQASDVARAAKAAGAGCHLDLAGKVACWGPGSSMSRLLGRKTGDVSAAEAVAVNGLPTMSYDALVTERTHPYLRAYRRALLEPNTNAAMEKRLDQVELRGTIDGDDRELTLMAADHGLRVLAPHFLEAAAERRPQFAAAFKTAANELRALERVDSRQRVAEASAIIDKLRPIKRPVHAQMIRSGKTEDLLLGAGLQEVTKLASNLERLFGDGEDQTRGSRAAVDQSASIAALTIALDHKPDIVFEAAKQMLIKMAQLARDQTTASRR